MSDTSVDEDLARVLERIGLAAVYADWAGAISPFDPDYSPECDCIACTIFTELRKLLDEYKKLAA